MADNHIISGDQIVLQLDNRLGPGAVNISPGGSVLLDINSARKKFYIYNSYQSAAAVIVMFANSSAPDKTVTIIQPGDTFVSKLVCWTGTIYIDVDAASATVYGVQLL